MYGDNVLDDLVKSMNTGKTSVDYLRRMLDMQIIDLPDYVYVINKYQLPVTTGYMHLDGIVTTYTQSNTVDYSRIGECVDKRVD